MKLCCYMYVIHHNLKKVDSNEILYPSLCCFHTLLHVDIRLHWKYYMKIVIRSGSNNVSDKSYKYMHMHTSSSHMCVCTKLQKVTRNPLLKGILRAGIKVPNSPNSLHEGIMDGVYIQLRCNGEIFSL